MTDLARVRSSLAGRYVVEKELGRGGMARVYLARDLKHGRHVALKLLSSTINDSAGTERFLREIRTTARLTHPAILPLHDSGEVDGVPFYTMPWVDGESLRDLIEREGALPATRAVEYAECIAEALAYAHGAGIIHRDIKPDNVLISRAGHLWVADFGLAHALASAASARLSSGVALGSPHYMSPEQALGQESLSGATDVYSLGCLLYEMLAGTPPFAGPVATVLSRHITEIPPDIREKRADVPEHVARAVSASLAKDPAQRPSASAVEAMLGGAAAHATAVSAPAWRRSSPRIGLVLAAVAAAVLTTASGAMLVLGGWETFASMIGRAPLADSMSYAVLSFAGDERAGAEDVKHLLTEAMGRWDGVSVVDPLRVSDIVAQRDRLSFEDLGGVARDLGAGKFVLGEVRRDSEWIDVRAKVYDAHRRNRTLAEASVRIPANLAGAESIIAMLADSLLFHDTDAPPLGGGVRGTHSVPALHAYLRGHAALRDWEPVRADSLFDAALQIDPSYSQARLWLAQLRHWAGRERTQWIALANRAAEDTTGLNAKEVVLAQALSALGNMDLVRACSLYGDLTRSEPHNFIALYGLGECLRRDSRVVADGSSPTGWRFRSSAQQAVNAYRRAFTVLPASHKAFRGTTFDAVRTKFYTDVSTLRLGSNEDGVRFVAGPQWIGDSLAFHPVPQVEAGAATAALTSATTTAAVRKMRGVFHEVTRAWVAAYPRSPAALEAEAVALELIGADAALDVLRSARAAVTDDPDYALHLLVSELWLRTKRALPSDTAELRAVVTTADSLLSGTSGLSQVRAERLSTLAALTGRAVLAAGLSRRGATPERINMLEISTSITGPGLALLTFSAMNGPVDSIRALEAHVERAIQNILEPERQEDVRAGWIARAATMAFPVYRSPLLTPRLAERDYLVAAQLALRDDDAERMQHFLDKAAAARAPIPPAAWRSDGLYPEAWMMAQVHGIKAAGPRLCPMLSAISWSEPGQLRDVAAAGSLPLAMLLYSRALRAQGAVREADRWYNAVAILWSKADPHLQRTLRAQTSAPPTTVAKVAVPTQSSAASSCTPGGQ